MRRLITAITALVLICTAFAGQSMAVTSSDILKKLRVAEVSVTDIKSEMEITDANKGNVSEMGKGYGDILLLEKATVYWKKPNLMRFDGYAKGIKLTYVQNGYKKLILATMLRKVDDVKDAPGKRQDSIDIGFLTTQLWKDNNVTVVSTDKKGIVKLKFVPKFGDKDKRHDNVWIDPATLKVLKREKYRGSGELRVKYTYSGFVMAGGKLPVATESKMYAADGGLLGTVNYKNLKANTGLRESLFSLSQR